MSSDTGGHQRATVRRALSWALIGALCVAAITAIAALLTDDFGETDWRVIGTSLGFAVFSATAASGASLRFRDSENLRTLGFATMALSAVAFLLLLGAMWSDDSEGVWRWFGSAALAALACSHLSLVSGTLRSTDSPTVRTLTTASMVLGVMDAFFGVLAVSGAVEEVEDGFGQTMAVLVILLLLSTALPPILRRLEPTGLVSAPRNGGTLPGAEAAGSSHPAEAPLQLASEVLAAADRIQALNGDPGNRASEIRRECERLRQLARSHSR